MGGRSYHPRLGRFFSPDPLVISPLDAQAYNRYAYVRNGPLTATDPTGYGEEDVNGDGGSEGNEEDLPYHCEESDCYRSIVVGASTPDTSLGAWNRALQFFESPNGPGQGGPDFGGGGHPYSPNGVRHGNDHGQPGGSPAFTIHVTPDMCAQIAASAARRPYLGAIAA